MTRFLDYRKTYILALQACLFAASYYGSFLLRFDFRIDGRYQHLLWTTLPMATAIELVVFSAFGLVRGWWRYVGMSDALDIGRASLTSIACLYVAMEFVVRVQDYPRSVLVINLLMTLLLVGGTRFGVRAYTEGVQRSAAELNTLIVGAGAAGSTLARELTRKPALNLRPLGFVDDDCSKHGIRIHGIKVFCGTAQLADVIDRLRVQCVLIAIPSATGRQIEQIISKCRQCKVDFKILPPYSDQISGGRSSFAHVRAARLEDLLGRQPVHVDLVSIQNQLEGKVMLITGAGGSIGSELTRQIMRFRPQKLVLVDRSENSLFTLGLELHAAHPDGSFASIIADIQDVAAMRDVLSRHRPDIVFHAAAYKHVPLMEQSCFEAVSNNVFGTYNVATLARQFGCSALVMISSDKAVRPTSVMGVTKRIAELIILSLQYANTRYVAVRFGNVLGSSGSVVPTFEKQIAEGGPVTVTHPDARRYFMTIPEAVQLVLQASSMGSANEIFVLEMGDQIRITDLARNLIRLSGFEPDEDIPIIYTGLRPGEKLEEELMLDAEELKRTRHPKIRVLDGGPVSFEQVQVWLDELSALVEAKNVHGLVQLLRQIVPEYHPSPELLALCELDRHDMLLAYRKAGRELRHSAVAVADPRATLSGPLPDAHLVNVKTA